MNKSIIYIIIICCILIVFIGLIGMTIQHEMAHKTFFSYYGIESEIHLNWFGLAGGYTEPNTTDLSHVSENDNRVLTMLNSINEIYWYPFLMMYFIISVFFVMCLMFFIRTWESIHSKSNDRSQYNPEPQAASSLSEECSQ